LNQRSVEAKKTVFAMLRIAFSIFAGLFVFTLLSARSAGKEETIDELKTRYESAHPEDRPELAMKIAQRQLRDADRFYVDGKVDRASAAVADIVSYSEKARDYATQTNKRLKNVEIDVRKIADKLRDIKRTLAFEDQPTVEQAIHRLEDIRTSLLQQMFAKDKKKDQKQ
jgi:hypothetical protein